MTTHGLSHHPLYPFWSRMMSRCYNRKLRQFKDWGGRGIRVCPRWHSVQLFIEDIESSIGRPLPGMTLDRTDNNSDYGPGKVRWATRATQNRNSRRYVDGTRSDTLYRTWWRLMQQRPEEVCERWHDLAAFRADVALLGPRPAGERFSRLDVSKPYGPGNVAWVTGAQQIKQAHTSKPGPRNGHGMVGHPLYNTWKGLAHNHSARLHEPWLDVRVFIKDIEAELGSKPAGTVLRLIDPDGRYEPGHVCWGKAGRPARAH